MDMKAKLEQVVGGDSRLSLEEQRKKLPFCMEDYQLVLTGGFDSKTGIGNIGATFVRCTGNPSEWHVYTVGATSKVLACLGGCPSHIENAPCEIVTISEEVPIEQLKEFKDLITEEGELKRFAYIDVFHTIENNPGFTVKLVGGGR